MSAERERQEHYRPNILLITVDQLRTDAVGAYGQCVAPDVTPNIDRLAEDSIRFAGCYTVSPVCAPARASLMTGRYPHCHGQLSNGFRMGSAERPFWDVLAETGYDSAGIGKMHVEPWNDPLGWHYNRRIEGKDFRGRDEYAEYLLEKGYGFTRPRFAPGLVEKPFFSTDFIGAVAAGDTIDEYIADRAVDYLRGRARRRARRASRDEADHGSPASEGAGVGASAGEDAGAGEDPPFIAWVSFCNPHHPLDPPHEYFAMFEDAPVPPHTCREEERDTKPPEQHVHRAWDEIDEEKRIRAWRAYYACTRLVDEQVGRVLEALEESGERENTVVVFTSDHGEMLFDHGLFDKAFFFYESVVRVPLLVSVPQSLARAAPGSASGAQAAEPRVVEALCENIDLVPTILELAGVSPPRSMQGRSLLPLISGSATSHRLCCVSEHFYIRMVRTATEKLVFYGGKPYGELYDLSADPGELDNLWDRPEAAPLRARLTEALAHWAIDAAEPAFRQLPAPTNKGAYDWVFRDDEDVHARYFSW